MAIFNGNGRRHTGPAHYPDANPTTFESIPEVPGQATYQDPHRPTRKPTTASSNRPMVWPFHGHSRSLSRAFSAAHSRSHSSAQHSAKHSHKTSMSTFARRNSRFSMRPASSVLGSDVIPDYVVNFIRGETPESLARKREHKKFKEANRGRRGHSKTASFFMHTRMASGGKDLENMGGPDGNASTVKKLTVGWRWGVTLNILMASLMLLIGLISLVVVVTSSKYRARATVLTTGECSRINSIDHGVHAMLNVFAFFFIAASSYISQIVVSPSRNETSLMHSMGRWVDIGIPSLRNLTAISTPRALLSATIIFLAVATQMSYNALIFTKKSKDQCSLVMNAPTLAAVTVLNLLFIIFASLALVRQRSDEPLLTVGDAIASFTCNPDPATDGACLLTKDEVTSGHWTPGEAKSKYWFSESSRWSQMVSRMRWLVWSITLLLPAGMTAAMLGMAMVDKPNHPFVSLTPNKARYPLAPFIESFGLCLVTALPHILLASLYYSTNALASVFYLSREFCQFYFEVRPLRVSGDAVGVQHSSSYITLPRAISVVLFMLFSMMGFMLSQAFNFVVYESGAYVSLNPLPLVVLLTLLGVNFLFLVGLSHRRSDYFILDDGSVAGNPLTLKGGSCSVIISARCHRSSLEGPEIAHKELSWGVVPDGGEYKAGHCAFSSRPVEAPAVGKAYS